MADTRTDGAHPQAATHGWSGAGGEQARLAAAHPSTGTGPKKHQAWRGTGSAMSVHAAPSQVRNTYAQRVFPPPPLPQKPQTLRRLRSGAKTRRFRCAEAQHKAERGKKQREMWPQRTSRGQNVRHCARSMAIHSRSSRAAPCVVTT